MIRAVFDPKAPEMTVQGHAGSGEVGKDLVCAAVSGLMLTMEACCGGCLRPGLAWFRGGERAAYRVIWKGLERLEREYPACIQCREKGERV